MVRPALGRGLGSLIPQKQTITEQIMPEVHQKIQEVPVSDLHENPRQPRANFSPRELEDLINSIQEYGIIQPLIVTRNNGEYELIAGERRLRAARTLGLKTVPAIVRNATDQQKLELALIENIQRQDLNAIEEALAYKALIEEFNLTQEQVAKRVGKDRTTVTHILRLLELPEEILTALIEGRISKTHARTLLGESDRSKQTALFHRILEGGVSVREVEARVSANSKFKRPQAKKDPNIVDHEKHLRQALGTKVDIIESAGKGKITIHFYSREELLDLLDRLNEC